MRDDEDAAGSPDDSRPYVGFPRWLLMVVAGSAVVLVVVMAVIALVAAAD